MHLQLDSEGSVPVLVAENLASFKREPGSLVCHMSLLGDELAYSLSASAALPAAVIVVNWNIVPPHAEGDKYHKRTIYPSERRAVSQTSLLRMLVYLSLTYSFIYQCIFFLDLGYSS